MEPERLNPSSDEAIDALLRQARPAPLRDDGFSTRVLAALPPPAPAHRPARWTRPAAIAVGAVAGSLLLLLGQHNASESTSPSGAQVLGQIEAAVTPLLQPQVGLALLTAAVTVLLVYAPDLRRRFTL